MLTAHVVGPPNDTDGVETAGAACLVPVHPPISHAISGFDRRREVVGGGDRGSDILDGRGGREACKEDGEEEEDEEVDRRHRNVCSVLYIELSGCLYVVRCSTAVVEVFGK